MNDAELGAMIERPRLSGLHLVPVLAGGGTRLAAHVGVLAALDDLGVRYARIVGVSGGSIVAALRAAGWSPARMLELVLDINFARFRGRSLVELIQRGGLSSGDGFEEWLDTQLEGKSFVDLAIDLAVVATDVRSGRHRDIRSANHARSQGVARGALLDGYSAAVFVSTVEGGLLVDGSILSEDALHRDWSGNGTPVCLFRMRSEAETRPMPLNRLFPLSSYINMLIRTFMTTISREFVDARYWPRTVVIDTGPCSLLEFKLDRAQKSDLYRRGFQTTCEILPLKFEIERVSGGTR